MAAQKKQQINLLPKEEFAGSTFGRIIRWLVSTFRVIVILTEGVVMLVFFSRFYLDARITDLSNEINQKQKNLQFQSSFESDFRATQAKLKIANEMLSKDKSVIGLLNTFNSYTPSETYLSSFNLIGNKITVQAQTPTSSSISQLIANLTGSQLYERVDLTKVNSTREGSFDFTMDLYLKGGS